MKRHKAAAILALKVFVSAGLLLYFLSRIHVERFVETFASANLSFIAEALVIYLLTQAISAVRWAVLARPLGIQAPFKDLASYCLIGMFFNLFAPGTVGGDVTRVYYLVKDQEQTGRQRWSVSTMHATMSVLMDRVIGMGVLVWLGAAGLLLYPNYAVPSAIRKLTFALALAFLIGGLAMPLLRRFLPQDSHPLVVKLRLILMSYRDHWQAIPQAVVLSFLVHLVQSWMHVVMGRALNLNIPFSFAIIVYPLVGTFSALPVSLNGLGLREGGYIFMLAVIGINSEKSIAVGLLLFLIVALDSLLGGLLFLIRKTPQPLKVRSEVNARSDNG